MKSKCRHLLDGWLRRLRAGLLLGFDSLVLLNRRDRRPRHEGAIFCLHGLGDLLLAGHAITRLAGLMRSRGLQSVLFVHPDLAGFARRHFDADRVEGIDRHHFTRRLTYRAATLKAVAGRFVLAVQPAFNRMLRVEDCLMRATGAPERIGSAGHAPFISPPERWWGDRFYTRLILARREPMHELERYAEFMAGMGLAIPAELWRLPKNGQQPQGATDIHSPYLVVSPNASDRRRSWPLENFLRATRRIAARHRLAAVLIGDEKNPWPIRWPDTLDPQPELVDLSGRTSLEDLPDLLARAELVMANDSGIYHLGVSLGRPTVAVGGSGLPTRYFPYPRAADRSTKVLYRPVPCAGCNWRCVYTASRTETAWCLQQVSWLELAEAADELLRPKS